ncbi:DUF6119 family protein [Tritonibacter mobilis]|uniref:DUF6119 family protein n=1 Tax=Tritonibacter mobilis TaxID=379347 RepID=UPI000806881C|nr:DUF6119 family protein [Tritonibacter mobilis]
MSEEIGQISIYLAKENNTFESVLQDEKVEVEGDYFKTRKFSLDDHNAVFYCRQMRSEKPNPPWLDFVNEQIEEPEQKVNFASLSVRPSGVLLLDIDGRILAATFGASSRSMLDKTKFLSDFGIKTAMNMCGNTDLRQTKSKTHTLRTQQIDRQISLPSNSNEFGMQETELLKYISAHMADDKKVTLQGKDSLTVKVIGDDKLTWDRLLDMCINFLAEYQKQDYKSLFPNYPNLEEVDEETKEKLNSILIDKIKAKDFSKIHLAIPDFLSDDEYSFSYSNFLKKQNTTVAFLDTSHIIEQKLFNLDKVTVKNLKSRQVFAYSHAESKILSYKKWDFYSCIVFETSIGDEYFVLSEGEWRKVDDDFYKSIEDFITNSLVSEPVDTMFHNINIFNGEQNREEKFNDRYVELRTDTIKFDKSKLKIGHGTSNNEFCDILELTPESLKIIHVKRHGGSSSVNHLFSQARYYGEAFLSDQVFLTEIRDHINASGHSKTDQFLNRIKPNIADVSGRDFEVCLWVLYDNKIPIAPAKEDLPLMAKYEIKLCHDRLRNIQKYRSVKLSLIPVEQVNKKKTK